MSKLFRVTVASAAIASVAALTPLSAQAKDVPDLAIGTDIAVAACSAPGDAAATGRVTGSVAAGLGFSVRVPAPAVQAPAVLEARARVYTVDAAGKKVFTTRRARVSFVSDVGAGRVGPGQHIWRLDVTDLNAEARGLPALLYTSAGFVACD